MTTRRTFLKYAATLGGAATWRMSLQRALAIDPEPNSTWADAEHVVILMQENRSFDHVFGTLRGVRGFEDPRAMRLADGMPVYAQRGASGKTYLPWRLDIRQSNATWTGSVPHSRHSQVDAWNEGGQDRWIDAKISDQSEYRHIPLTMGYYTREDLPFYYALADAFTICDQHYCGAMTSTTPNRLIFMTGTVRDRQDHMSRVYMRNDEILEGGMRWTTFPERLQEAGVDWKFYQNEIDSTGTMTDFERDWLGNFGTNVLECFDKYRVSDNPGFVDWIDALIAKTQAEIKNAVNAPADSFRHRAGEITRLQMLLRARQRRRASASHGMDNLTPEERDLYQRAFTTNIDDVHYRMLDRLDIGDGNEMQVPKGDLLHQFRTDVEGGTLPCISWLSPPAHFSDHPSSPWYGAWYVSEVLDILTRNPDVWRKTIFIITYDENDGYFDHACCYASPDPFRPATGGSSQSVDDARLEYTIASDETALGVPQHLARNGPVGLGFRVPLSVASPWSRGGWVNSQLFEHSSTLQFLEKFVAARHGKTVRETNISQWRRSISGDLTSCFRPHGTSTPRLKYVDRDAHLRMIAQARRQPTPTGYHVLNKSEDAAIRANAHLVSRHVRQEPGTRPSCALPYEPFADGGIDATGNLIIHLRAGKELHGEKSAGLPFNVYRYGADTLPGLQVGTYAVTAGDAFDVHMAIDAFKGDKYDIVVHAPNGFYRRFRGRKEGLRLRTWLRQALGRGMLYSFQWCMICRVLWN